MRKAIGEKMKFAALLFLFPGLSFAMPDDRALNLAQYFSQELQKVNNLAAAQPAKPPGPNFPLQDINVDVSPTATFGVSGIISLTISPEIDFVLVPASVASAIAPDEIQRPQ
jgi:hypothetical protein